MSYLRPYCTKVDFAVGAYSAPRSPSWNKGDLLLSEGEGPGKEKEKERKKGRYGEGRTGKGKGGREGNGGDPMCIFKFS